MAGAKSIFTGPPKPDKKAQRRLDQQLASEQRKAESTEKALAASRRARNAGGGLGRSGLAYSAPGGGTLG